MNGPRRLVLAGALDALWRGHIDALAASSLAAGWIAAQAGTGDGDFGALAQAIAEADAVVLVIEAAAQPDRHACRALHLAHLLGVRPVVFAVAGLDRVGDPQGSLDAIAVHGERQARAMGAAAPAVFPLDAPQRILVGLQAGDEAREVAAAAAPEPATADRFECTLAWLGASPLLVGREYTLRSAAGASRASITELKHRVDVQGLGHVPARTLAVGEFGVCTLALERPLPLAPNADNPKLGAFALHESGDDPSEEPHLQSSGRARVAVGLLHFALRRSQNVHPQALDVDQAARAALMGQQPAVVWLTGLSGAGKSTIANLLVRRLHAAGRHTYLLDGDNLRHGLNRDLGFTAADRVENIRRAAEVARLMVDAGLIVVTAFISPFRAERAMARRLFAPGRFFEVHVHAPLEVAEGRDPKGLYAKARRGELPNFTGLDSPYEAPGQPDIVLDTTQLDAAQAADRVWAHLQAAGVLGAAGTTS